MFDSDLMMFITLRRPYSFQVMDYNVNSVLNTQRLRELLMSPAEWKLLHRCTEDGENKRQEQSLSAENSLWK